MLAGSVLASRNKLVADDQTFPNKKEVDIGYLKCILQMTVVVTQLLSILLTLVFT